MNTHQIDVVKQVLDLAGTARIGLDYVAAKTREDEFQNAFSVLTDVVAAFAGIEDSLAIVNIPEKHAIYDVGAALRDTFRRYTETYEAGNFASLPELVDLTMVPRYEAWHEALERELRRYVGS